MDYREEMKQLRETLNANGYLYYVLDAPTMSDYEYDHLMRRLEELVIAIDTSGSCSREVVSRFLSETYAILSRQENFFRRMKVYFIQCDCLIQDVALIRNREDWLAYEKKIRIRGRGGTDFTPVFDYVEKQRQQLHHFLADRCDLDGGHGGAGAIVNHKKAAHIGGQQADAHAQGHKEREPASPSLGEKQGEDQGDGQAQEHIFDVGHPIVTAFQRRGSSATKDVVSVKSTAK